MESLFTFGIYSCINTSGIVRDKKGRQKRKSRDEHNSSSLSFYRSNYLDVRAYYCTVLKFRICKMLYAPSCTFMKSSSLSVVNRFSRIWCFVVFWKRELSPGSSPNITKSSLMNAKLRWKCAQILWVQVLKDFQKYSESTPFFITTENFNYFCFGVNWQLFDDNNTYQVFSL